jgi:hypothetical protein
MHIKQMVKEFKSTDERFKNETNAIRYFVHLGISAQQATENLRNSLDNTIVKNSIKETVRKEISFHSAHIETLESLIEDFTEKTEANFQEIARRTNSIEDQINSTKEIILKSLNYGVSTGEHALRNLIVLRSIFYVFFLGYRTGRITPGKENLTTWHRIIELAHKKANELSIKEINLISADVVESVVIKQMADEIYKDITRLPEPMME